jgi:hypothetical protein
MSSPWKKIIYDPNFLLFWENLLRISYKEFSEGKSAFSISHRVQVAITGMISRKEEDSETSFGEVMLARNELNATEFFKWH